MFHEECNDMIIFSVITHWQRVAEKLIIKEWQDGMARRKRVPRITEAT